MTTNGTQVSLAAKGAKGDAGTAGGGSGVWQPNDIGLVGWTFDPEMATANVTQSAGILYLMRAKMAVTGPVSQVGLSLRSTAPAGLTNTFVGVYSQSGATATLIGSSGDISASVNGVAVSTLYSLSSPTASQAAGTSLLIGFLFGSATTATTMLGLSTSGRGNGFIASKQNFRALVWSTGLTALPASMDLSTAPAGDGGSVPAWVLA